MLSCANLLCQVRSKVDTGIDLDSNLDQIHKSGPDPNPDLNSHITIPTKAVFVAPSSFVSQSGVYMRDTNFR